MSDNDDGTPDETLVEGVPRLLSKYKKTLPLCTTDDVADWQEEKVVCTISANDKSEKTKDQ